MVGGQDRRTKVELSPGQDVACQRFHIKVQTSDLQGAGTSARVFITLQGTNGRGICHELTALPASFKRSVNGSPCLHLYISLQLALPLFPTHKYMEC